MAAHPHVPPAKLVIEAPVDPLYCRALVVAANLRCQLPDPALGQRFPFQFGLLLPIPPWVAVDDRHVFQLLATGPDRFRAIRAVHRIE